MNISISIISNFISAFAQRIKSLIIVNRFDVSHDQMFSEKNYMPGLRRWIQPLEATSIACDIIIEEFKDFKNYLKVKSILTLFVLLSKF